MKAYFTSTQTARALYSEPVIPQWISDLGLEWLYCLLSSPSSVKSTARG